MLGDIKGYKTQTQIFRNWLECQAENYSEDEAISAWKIKPHRIQEGEEKALNLYY